MQMGAPGCGGLLAEGVADKPPNGDGVPKFLALALEQLADAGVGILHEVLYEEAALGIELAQLPLGGTVNLVGRDAPGFELLASNLLLGFDEIRGNVLAVDSSRGKGCDVESEILDERAEIIVGRRGVVFATHLDKDADLSSEVNVGGDYAGAFDRSG